MSQYHGDIRLGDTLDIKFTTRQISGAPFTLAGSPVISAYPANSTTQLTAGITLSVDFDSVTGLNNVRVVASGGNGYLTATNYELVITTGTVNSVSVVGECIGSFSIENRSALMPTTAARTLVVDAAGIADANMVKAGPTGSGTAQTARDLGASVLLSSGTGTGQLDFTSGVVKANATQWLGGTIPAVNVTGVPKVDVTHFKGTGSAGQAGYAGIDWNAIANPTAAAPSVHLFDTGNAAITASSFQNGAIDAAAIADGAIDAATFAVGAVDAAALAADAGTEIATAVWATVLDGTNSAIKLMKGFAAAMLGKASGLAATTAKYRNIADSKDVITATVDTDGNRSAVTLDLT